MDPDAGDIVCAVPFHPYCGGVVMRTQNVSEYMLVLVLCLVIIIITDIYKAQYRLMTTI